MKAQVLTRYDDPLTAKEWVSEEKVADPKIEKSTDVIVRIGGAGVCRTDLHIIEGVWRPFTDPTGDKLLPLIMGHENAGWVEAVGKEVEGIKVGDPVIVHPKVTGGTCLACRRGFDMHGPGKFPGSIRTEATLSSSARRSATSFHCRRRSRRRTSRPTRTPGSPPIAR
jgi:NAD+-dependent secondary alcohol dehydrogenase Adh1